jgi:hypothetical protein
VFKFPCRPGCATWASLVGVERVILPCAGRCIGAALTKSLSRSALIAGTLLSQNHRFSNDLEIDDRQRAHLVGRCDSIDVGVVVGVWGSAGHAAVMVALVSTDAGARLAHDRCTCTAVLLVASLRAGTYANTAFGRYGWLLSVIIGGWFLRHELSIITACPMMVNERNVRLCSCWIRRESLG